MDRAWVLVFLSCGLCSGSAAESASFPALVEDRASVERVYHRHRLQNTAPFEEVLSRADLERLVQRDLQKENLLKREFGIEISEAEIEAETKRIETATRAPEILAELKRALGNDAARFGQTVVRPLLVEKHLQALYSKSHSVHQAGRSKAEELRSNLLQARQTGAGPAVLLQILGRTGTIREVVWRISTTNQNASASAASQTCSAVASVGAMTTREVKDALIFEELHPQVQELLRAQLRNPGDVSGVVETDHGFWLFLAREHSDTQARAAAVCIEKPTFPAWLEQHSVASVSNGSSESEKSK